MNIVRSLDLLVFHAEQKLEVYEQEMVKGKKYANDDYEILRLAIEKVKSLMYLLES